MIVFFNLAIHYFVCLKVDLYFFIQFILYEVIPPSQVGRKFVMLTRVKFFFFYLFLNLFFQFVIQRLIC